MFENITLKDFINKTSSKDPVPGGGSVAALCSVLSCSLTEMVTNLTIGKEKYKDYEAEMEDIKEKMSALSDEFYDYINKDADAFSGVMKAFKLPKETEEEKESRKAKIQESLKEAAIVPYEVAEMSFDMMKLIKLVVLHGNTNAVTDGMVAAMLSRTAVLSAILNVKINLNSIKDEDFVKNYRDKIELLTRDVEILEKEILDCAEL